MTYSPVVQQSGQWVNQVLGTQDVSLMTETELEQKTRQLEQYRLTAPYTRIETL